VGTPPNLALVRIFEQTFPAAAEAGFSFSFGQWILFGVPLSTLLLAVIWFLLTKVFFRPSSVLEFTGGVIEEEQKKLGPVKYEEKVVLAVFTATALLWVFRKDLVIGSLTIPGWSGLLPTGSLLDDGTIAITMALILFLVPTRSKDSESEGYGTILDFGVFAKVPWHIVLLFGGGFALAKGFTTSGLSAAVGNACSGLEGPPPFVMVALLCGVLTFLTELTSNTATTEMILPLLASIAVGIKVHPLILMIPAALSASCAFMMPVATPPNAIVFGSRRIRIGQMVRVGIVINLIAIALISILFFLLAPLIFGIDFSTLPDWAETATGEP